MHGFSESLRHYNKSERWFRTLAPGTLTSGHASGSTQNQKRIGRLAGTAWDDVAMPPGGIGASLLEMVSRVSVTSERWCHPMGAKGVAQMASTATN